MSGLPDQAQEDATWKCRACDWKNLSGASECDGCGERKATATSDRYALAARLSALEGDLENWEAAYCRIEQIVFGDVKMRDSDDVEERVAALEGDNADLQMRVSRQGGTVKEYRQIADNERTRRIDAEAKVAALEGERDTLREAVERIAEQQPKTLEMLRHHGVVFDGPLGADPKNFQHVAFSIYTDLCEVDSLARAALAAGERDEAWPEGFHWSEAEGRPVYSPQRGDASGEGGEDVGVAVSSDSVPTDAPQCSCQWGASGSHHDDCPCASTGEGTK